MRPTLQVRRTPVAKVTLMEDSENLAEKLQRSELMHDPAQYEA